MPFQNILPGCLAEKKSPDRELSPVKKCLKIISRFTIIDSLHLGPSKIPLKCQCNNFS